MNYGLPPDTKKDPINYIPEPPDDLSIQGNKYYYQICQWLMDREALSTGNVYYVGRLADTIDNWQEHSDKWPEHRKEKELDFIYRHGEIFNFATRDYRQLNIPPPKI